MPRIGILILTYLIATVGGTTGAVLAGEPHRQGPPQQRMELFEDLGTWHHAISTAHPLAQQYFDQGLRLVYAFNHEEAIRAFEEAARLDPDAAMAYWGIAYALGPNINAPMDRETERRAADAIQRAKAHSAGVSPGERAYVGLLDGDGQAEAPHGGDP